MLVRLVTIIEGLCNISSLFTVELIEHFLELIDVEHLLLVCFLVSILLVL